MQACSGHAFLAYVGTDRIDFSERCGEHLRYLSTTPVLLSPIHPQTGDESIDQSRTKQPWEPISGNYSWKQLAYSRTRADSILGLASCANLAGGKITLYISTHLSHIIAIEVSTGADNEGNIQCEVQRAGNSTLRQKLQTLQKLEDRRRNLGGLAVSKTWGLASLPKNEVVAACVSVHGGDFPEYSLPSQERSTIVFASDTGQDMFPWQGLPPAKDAIVTQKDVLKEISYYESVGHRSGSAFSNRIIQAANGARRLVFVDDNLEQVDELLEKCSICRQEVPFEGLIEATCVRGHQFGMFSAIHLPVLLQLRFECYKTHSPLRDCFLSP